MKDQTVQAHKNGSDCWCNPTEQPDGSLSHYHRSGVAIKMNDKELADKVVALGVGSTKDTEFYRDPNDWDVLEAPRFVRDWRVAGALIERCLEVDQIVLGAERPNRKFWCDLPTRFPFHPGMSDSLPRAIIEACVQALEEPKA